MASPAAQVSGALVAFALEGRFPDDDAVSSLDISSVDLRPAIDALERARQDLEAEISVVDQETQEDVSTWVRNARTLQEDIIRSKALANEIVRDSEAPDVSGRTIEDAEAKIEFIRGEARYSAQLHGVLERIRDVNGVLGEVEKARDERRILDSLHLLEKAWAMMDEIPVSKTCRVMRLLDIRSFELKSGVHEVFDHVWKALVQVDVDNRSFAIRGKSQDEQMSLDDAVVGLKAYKEVDERMEQLWHNLDGAIVSPRMQRGTARLPGLASEANSLRLDGESPATIEALLRDLETILVFVASKLPTDLLEVLCAMMMGDIVPKLVGVWLDAEVPASLDEIDRFQSVINNATRFCEALEEHGLSHFDQLKSWVDSAPTIWLAKCRETALDSVRLKLSCGVSASKTVERVEKQMVSRSEGKELAATGPAASADNNDWDAAWDDDEEDAEDEESSPEPPKEDALKETQKADDDDDGAADAWGWDDNDGNDGNDEQVTPVDKTTGDKNEEDDSAEAWGWGDDDANDDEAEPEPKPEVKPKSKTKPKVDGARRKASETDDAETREMILKETYIISSMPDPVLELIFSILEDGAALTQECNALNPVASTAPGLFSLPTFALALFRGISPYYYSKDTGGNMFLYNDATYLAERLTDFSAAWKSRDDLTKRAQTMLRLDNDIKSLQGFANRSYSNELNLQKTVLRDLLGGSDTLMQQDDQESCIESAVLRVHTVSSVWEPILARSVWTQAVGSLADCIASKLVADVAEMSSIGQEEAYRIAQLIAKATELDDLFVPSRLLAPPPALDGSSAPPEAARDEIPATAQYAPSWLRLKYLSEVLQSNLNEVRFLWFESELSLCFSAEEVVDLINASFEANARSREVIREIQQKPHPVGGGM